MGSTLLDLLYINIFVVIVIDQLRIDQPVKRLWWRWVMGKQVPFRDFSAKPFDCSLCLSWWLGLAYVLVTVRPLTIGYILLPLAYANFNFIINDLIILLREGWSRLMNL